MFLLYELITNDNIMCIKHTIKIYLFFFNKHNVNYLRLIGYYDKTIYKFSKKKWIL